MTRFSHLIAAGCLAMTPVLPAAAQTIEKPNITIAVGGSISQMNKVAYVVALHRDYFKLEGLNVTSVDFDSGTKAVQSVIGGSADVGEGAFEHTLRLQTKNQELTCLADYGRYPGNVLVVRKSEADQIKTIADLKGKTIGVSAPGASTQNFVAGLLERAGVNWKDAKYISVGTGSSAVAAMRTGKELDALVNLDPAISNLVDGGDAVILSDSRAESGTQQAFGGPYLADCLFVKGDFLRANPNTSQAIANAIVHSMQWLITASVDDVMKITPPEYYKSGEKLYRESLAANISAFQWDGIITDEAAKNVLASISTLEPALKTAKIDFSKTHDNELIKKALAKYHAPLKE